MKEVLKFHYETSGRDLAPFPGFEELNAARQEVRRLGLLGVDENGVGYGNVSLRDGTDFYITGSGAGALPALTLQDYAKVVAWDFERNWLRCEGRVIASAESLTHAAVYSMDAEAQRIVHGHDESLWRQPTGARSVHERGCALWHARDGARGPTTFSRDRCAHDEAFRDGWPHGWNCCLRP